MLVFAKRRLVHEGVTFDDYKQGWKAESGYPVKNRVLNAIDLDDPRDILTFGFIDMPRFLAGMASKKGAEEDEEKTDRHDRVDELVEKALLNSTYHVANEYEFGANPRAIKVGSHDSLMRFKSVDRKRPQDLTQEKPMLADVVLWRLRDGVGMKELNATRIAAPIALDARVLDLQKLDDKQEILSLTLYADARADDLPSYDQLTESVTWALRCEFRSEHDFKKPPMEVAFRGPDSIFRW